MTFIRNSIKLMVGVLLASSVAFLAVNAEEAAKPAPEPFAFETKHQGTFGGKRVNYTATVSNLMLKRGNGDVYAEAVTIAYVMDKADKRRPVTFVFNGGPGGASVLLHMGVMSPKHVPVPTDGGDTGLAPYQIQDNPAAMLDITDLVFIDPIGTGYSRLAGTGKPEDVYGLEEDARSVSDIIREWVRVNNRWNAPKYIAGESFGTTRAAAMMPYLQGGAEPMRINGLIMVSQAMDYTGSTPVPDNMLAHVTYLPTLAATARYHGKLANSSSDLASFMDEVRAFAVDEYLPALFRGSSLEEGEENRIAVKLAGYTGLNIDYIKRAKLRILTGRFRKELLRDTGEIVGSLDGRYKSKDLDGVGASARFDVSSNAVGAAYTPAFREYLRNDLGVTLERPYYSSGPDVTANWVYDRSSGYNEPSYVNTAPQLADAMVKNPSLRVLVASGYYDLITPFLDAEYTIARHGIDTSRVTMTYYEAGHAMYVNEDAFDALIKDMRAFIASE
ncbi:S10 family peptidase [Kordiimonas aquimaris]|uniref:S10 family peptidase n=1 Tax=Kordiimonas aquimaris TaxID=707591 RepID=UPI0021CF4C93|nr:peptidase S10 [Kordiimonas aquimaris]